MFSKILDRLTGKTSDEVKNFEVLVSYESVNPVTGKKDGRSVANRFKISATSKKEAKQKVIDMDRGKIIDISVKEMK